MAIKVTHVRDDFRTASPRIKALIVGEPGAGKTRTASTWPNVLYANAEGGLLSVRDRDVRSVDISSTNDLDELRAMLAQTPEVRAQMLRGPVDTVVIDTVDEVARIIIRERLEAEKHETMEMRDWGYLGDTLRSFVRGYRNLELNVLFLVHVKGQEDSATGRLIYKPSIQGAMGDELAAYVDEAVLLVARPASDPKTGERTIKRYMQTFPDIQHEFLKDRSGKLPMEFPINFDDDYQRLADTIFEPEKVHAEAREELQEIKAELAEETTKPAKKKPAKAKLAAAHPAPVIATPDAPDAPVAAPVPAAPEPDPLDDLDAPPVPVPDVGTEPAATPDPLADLEDVIRCSECGKPVEGQDYVDLSIMRFGAVLCREHFAARKTRR